MLCPVSVSQLLRAKAWAAGQEYMAQVGSKGQILPRLEHLCTRAGMSQLAPD